MRPQPTPTSVPAPARHRRAILMLVLATAFWGLSFPVVKALALVVRSTLEPDAGNWFVTAATVGPRFVLGALVLLAVEIFRARKHARATLKSNAGSYAHTTRNEWKQGLVIGLFSATGMIFQNDGLQFTEASTSAFLTEFTAILVPLWLALRHRRNPGWLVWTCCALVLAGVAILGHVNLHASRFGRGELETLLCAVFFTGQILTLDSPAFAGNRYLRVTLVMFATQTVIYIVMALLTVPASASAPAALLAPWTSAGFIVLTLVLTTFCTLGAYLLMNAWQPKITATEAGLIYCVEPIFGSLFALVLPAIFATAFGIAYANETVTWTLLAGGALITGANVLLQTRPPSRA